MVVSGAGTSHVPGVGCRASLISYLPTHPDSLPPRLVPPESEVQRRPPFPEQRRQTGSREQRQGFSPGHRRQPRVHPTSGQGSSRPGTAAATEPTGPACTARAAGPVCSPRAPVWPHSLRLAARWGLLSRSTGCWRKAGGGRGCQGHWPGHSLGLGCSRLRACFQPGLQIPVQPEAGGEPAAPLVQQALLRNGFAPPGHRY